MEGNGLLDAPHPPQLTIWRLLPRADLIIPILCLMALVGCGHAVLTSREEDPLSAREHFTLGAIYEKRGEAELALREYTMALRKDSHFLPAMTRSAELSYVMGHYDQAESYYRKAIKLAPRNGDLYNNLCWVYLSQGRKLKKAERLITVAMEVNPEHKGYYLDTLGAIYLEQHRFREAIEALEAAASFFDETQPDLLGQVYKHLGAAYDGIGEGSKAEEAFKKARDLLER